MTATEDSRQRPGTVERPVGWRPTLVVGLAVGALFATTVTGFEARVTDIAARRILEGQVPYRDFWSMYAPGSYTVLAAAFAVFGRQLIVSNILGSLTALASVLAYHRMVLRLAPPRIASLSAVLVAIAFWSASYADGFTSYPAASLLIWCAVICLANYAGGGSRPMLISVGLCLGAAALFKHDIAGYASIATAFALLAMPGQPLATRLRAVAAVAAIVVAIVAAALWVLWRAGAGPDLVRDLVVFPLTDFKYVRPEYFPLFPRLRVSAFETIREVIYWSKCNLPLYALLGGLVVVWNLRRRLPPERLVIFGFAAAAYPLFWTAAHVQLNTHIITITALGAAVAAGAGAVLGLDRVRKAAVLAVGVAAAWGAVLAAEDGAKFAISLSKGREWVGLPRLQGIAVAPADAKWMRGLASALERADDPAAPLLMLSNRNDVVVYAEGVPYWLSDRRIVTRHHELHPGITDTAPFQRQMLGDVEAGLLPVIVREHRFTDEILDRVKADFLRHVAVGSPLLDHWVAQTYVKDRSFGDYELLRRRDRPPLVESRRE
jgi:hypothetical protein